LFHVRAQMSVTHRHLDRGVTHQLLNRLEGSAAHCKMARERMSQRVPAELAQPRPAANSAEDPLHHLDGERQATLLAEDEWAGKMAVRLQGRCDLLVQRHFTASGDLARAAAA